MRRKLTLTSVLLVTAMSANANTGSVSGSGQFSTMPGFGYEYSASWSSSENFSFEFAVTDNAYIDPITNRWNGEVYVGAQFTPESIQFIDKPFSMTSALEFRFMNLSTGEVSPPPVIDPLLSDRAHQQNYFSNIQVLGSPRDSIRFSNYSFSNNQNGLGSGLPAYEINFNRDVQFTPGNWLAPSNDTSCASFSCMSPGKDSILLGAYGFSITATVPDIYSWQAALAGLAFLQLARRMRAKS